MNILRRKPHINGQLGYYGLSEWWLSTFTEAERAYIEDIYLPLGAGKGRLTQGYITSSSATVCSFLSGLSTWFKKTSADRDIARRILAKAVFLADPAKDVLGVHFTYQALIQTWYRDRDTIPNALDEAIKACEGQIALAAQAAKQFKQEYPNSPLPTHVGYGQLATIYDKQGRFEDAIRITLQAKQQGWNGDWDSYITRYEKKIMRRK